MLNKSSETSSEHSDSNPEISDGNRIGSIGLDRQNSNSSDSDREMNNNTIETESDTARMSNSSSSGESSTCEDSFQIDTSMFDINFQTDVMEFNGSFQFDLPKFTTYSPSNPTSEQGQNYVSSIVNFAKSEVDNKKPPVPRPTFQVCDVTNYQNGISITTSPPVQVMDKSRGYDPARIPASVFERNGTPMEWSVCSNDSLFSLKLGNHSLTRENANTIGELAMSEELSKSSELNSFSRITSIIMEETDSTRESINSENLQANDASTEASKSLEERLKDCQNEEKDLLQTPSSKSSKFVVSNLSHGSSANSSQSSTSPTSGSQSMRNISYMECKKKRARPLCYCSNCSWAFCNCCSWTTCNCKCSTCGWACVNCWNCWNLSHTKGSDHASPILTEAERKCSMDDDIQKEPEVNSKSRWGNFCNWFHCCSCSPSCCRQSNCCSSFHCCSCFSSCCRWRLSCKWKPWCKFCC